MISVQNTLVIGIGMNGGHQTTLNTEFFVQNLSHRSQTVGSTGSVGNDMMLSSIIGFLVYAHYNSSILILAGSGQHHFLGTGGDMSASLQGIVENTGGFHHDINAQLAPGQIGRLSLAAYQHFFAVDQHIIVLCLDSLIPGTVYRVIFQQMSIDRSVTHIVDSHDLNLRLAPRSPENQTADTAETIDSNFNHNKAPLPFT